MHLKATSSTEESMLSIENGAVFCAYIQPLHSTAFHEGQEQRAGPYGGHAHAANQAPRCPCNLAHLHLHCSFLLLALPLARQREQPTVEGGHVHLARDPLAHCLADASLHLPQVHGSLHKVDVIEVVLCRQAGRGQHKSHLNGRKQ